MTQKPLISKEQDIYIKYFHSNIMKNISGLIILFLFTLIIIPQTLSINIRGGDIFLVRPNSPYIDHGYVPAEFLSVEDLVFYTCIEEKNLPVKSTVICLDDNSFKDISVVRWLDEENCYIGSYNLDDKDCRQIIIQSEYIKDDELVTIQKEIKVNRLSSILDLVARNQYSDGGWKNAVHTAAGVWVLSNFPDIYDDEIELGIEWLKLNRDNDEKCWPDKDCSMRTTAKILSYLTYANVNDSYRIMHDGIVYLENNQNFFLDDDLWNLDIKPFDPGTTNCLISYENNLYNEENFSMEYSEIVSYDITPSPNEILYVICDQNIQANLTTAQNEAVFIYEGDNLSYTTPHNCWSNDQKWGDCDITSTLFASIVNISEKNRELAYIYLENELRSERSGEMSIGPSKNVTDTALYAYFKNNTNVSSWLRYRQNNDGSWGNKSEIDNIIPTGFNLLGLMRSGFNRTNEVIEDAEKWVNEKELEFTLNLTKEYTAWNSTEKNAHAFIVLKNNARPVIKSNPIIILIDKELTEVEIYNPTTFDLEEVSFVFSDNLKDFLIIEPQDLIPSYSYVKQEITKKTGETGNIFGHLFVYNFDNEIGKIPVMITNFPSIEISSTEENILIFGTKSKISFDIIKTGHTFNCKISWDDSDISSQEDYLIDSNQLSVDVIFSSAERIEKTYKGTFTCVTGDQSFDVPVSLRISRYEAFPFTVTPDNILINESSQDDFIIIENKLDETLDVNLKFLKNEEYFEISRTSIPIDPNYKVNISIYNNVLQGINFSTTNIIEVSGLGQKKEVNFRAQIVAIPKKKLNPIIYWILLGILIAIIGTLGYFAYNYREAITNYLKKGSNIDSIKIKIKKLEEKEKQTAIMNMINILRILKKDDIQIRTRLKQEEFTDKEIDEAISKAGGGEEDEEDESTEDDLFGS